MDKDCETEKKEELKNTQKVSFFQKKLSMTNEQLIVEKD
jgi:hypothetical protein